MSAAMTPQSKLKWDRENTRVISAKLSCKYDHDIISYLENNTENNAAIIKKAIRLLIKTENGGNEK